GTGIMFERTIPSFYDSTPANAPAPQSLVLIIAVASLVGCAATVTQTSTSPSLTAGSRAQMPAGALVAVIAAKPIVQGNGDWAAFLEEWQVSLASSAATARMPFVLAKDETAMP